MIRVEALEVDAPAAQLKKADQIEPAALRLHARLVREARLEFREAQAGLALLAAIPVNRGAALALAEMLSGRNQTRLAETLVEWARAA